MIAICFPLQFYSVPNSIQKSSSMEWTEEYTIEFIDNYRNKEVLWDTKHRNYYSRIKKNDAWQELAEQFHITESECKKKVNGLLSSLRREKAKIKKSQCTGAALEDAYESNWYAFKSLLFLWDKSKIRETQSTIQDTENRIEENERTDDDSIETDSVAAETQESQTGATKRLTTKKFTGKRQKKIEDSKKLDEAFKILSQAASNSSKQENNECTAFGNLVAKKLAKYSSELQTTVQQDIMNILFKADRELHNQSSSSYSTGQSPSYHSRSVDPYFSNHSTPSSLPRQYEDSQGINYSSQQSHMASPGFTYTIIPDGQLQDL